jgi:hypothetical protein
MIAKGYLHFYDEIFALPGFLQDPCLIIGRQWIESFPGRPAAYDFPTVKSMMSGRGVREVLEVDLFDPDADCHHDLNTAFPDAWVGHFGTVFDAGTVEHVFDTATALRNCLSAVRPAGFCVFHVPVRGYYLHGLHTFSPELLPSVVVENGFELIYLKYSTPEGEPAPLDGKVPDLLQWVVARRLPGASPSTFTPIQQRYWSSFFAAPDERT